MASALGCEAVGSSRAERFLASKVAEGGAEVGAIVYEQRTWGSLEQNDSCVQAELWSWLGLPQGISTRMRGVNC